CPLADWCRLDRDLCGRLGFGAWRSPGRRLLRCFLSDYPSFSNRLSAPCRLADGRFLAFRLGSRFCRHGFLPGAHCIWNVFVRSLPNKKVSQQAKRLSSTIDRRQASTAGEPTISPSAMKIWAEAEGIARSNRERPCSQPA